MRHFKLWVVLSCVGLLAAIGSTPTTCASTIDFETQASFDQNVVIVEEGAGGTVAWSDDVGVGGTAGRVNVSVLTASGKGIYTIETYDASGGSVTASFFFLAEAFTTSTYSRIALGLSPDRSNLRASSETQVRLLKGNSDATAKFEVRDAGSASPTTGVTLTSGHWYEFAATFTKQPGNAFAVSATLTDYGSDGLTLVGEGPIATASGIRNLPADFLDDGGLKPLSVGILAQNDGGGAVAIDRFSIVPEPASLTLVSLGATLVVARCGRRAPSA